jgi:hypothetical protein
MSKIPAREFLRDEPSAKSSLDTILASPYTTLYEKPLRIMTVNPNGEEKVEVTRTTYKTINDTVTIDKITEICENVITDKMMKKEKSLLSQLLFSLGEQVIEVEKNLMSQMDVNIDNKVKNKHFDNLEKDLFTKLDNSVKDKIKQSSTKMMDTLDTQLTEFEVKMNDQKNLVVKKFEDFFSEKIKEEVDRSISNIHGHLQRMIEEEVRKAIDMLSKEDLNENCHDGICDLPEKDEVSVKIYDEESLKNPIIVSDYLLHVEDENREVQVVEDFIDENLLPDGSDMIFDDIQRKNKEVQVVEDFIDENLLPDGSDMIFDDIQRKNINKVEVIEESKEETQVVEQSKEEIQIAKEDNDEVQVEESKEEVQVVVETKEEVQVVVETKEEIQILEESKEEIQILEESKEEVQVVEESKEEVQVVEESKEEIQILEESKEEIQILEESKEEVQVVEETKEEIQIANEDNDEVQVEESKEEVQVVEETKEEIQIANEDNDEVQVEESKEEVQVVETKDEIQVVEETKEEVQVVEETKDEVQVVEESKEEIQINIDVQEKKDINIENQIIIHDEMNPKIEIKETSVLPKLPLSLRKKKKGKTTKGT